MAIDTQTKRRSAIACGLTFLVIAPLADETIGAWDRSHISGLYSSSAGITTNYIHIFSDADIEPDYIADNSNNVLVAGDTEVQGSSYVGGTFNIFGSWMYFGGQTTNGSWRIGPSGNDLHIERRVAGAWVTATAIKGA